MRRTALPWFDRRDGDMTDLETEISRGPWIYPWRLRDGRELQIAGPELESVHQTRADLIEPRVRAELARADGRGTALDLACNEGWFSHRLLDWGASRVLGLDVRASNIARATCLRDHFEIPPERFELRQADLFDLDPESLGQFDVVLLLGLIYHVENPMGALRLARKCTRGICVVETQLTRQTAPIVHGNGRTAAFHEAAGRLAVVV